MTSIREGNLKYKFNAGWSVAKYDDWAFYRNQFLNCGGRGNKGVDILAMPQDDKILWMIEVKDYSTHRRDKGKGPLSSEVAQKTLDTLAGIFAASVNAVDNEQEFARRAIKAKQIRVVLHLQQSERQSKLFPYAVDPADVRQKLKKLLKAVDPRVTVMNTSTNWKHWSASWAPQQ